MGIIQVFTSQCCCEVKLDRTIGLSFNLKVRQVAGTPCDSSYLHTKSPRLRSRESDQGPLTPGQRPLDPSPAANSAPSRNPELLPSPPHPHLGAAPAAPKEREFRCLGPDRWDRPERPNLLRPPSSSPPPAQLGPCVQGPRGSRPGPRRPRPGERQVPTSPEARAHGQTRQVAGGAATAIEKLAGLATTATCQQLKPPA